VTKEKIRETVEFYNTCKACGNEFRVYAADNPQEICYGCQTKLAIGAAKEKLLPFIGAKVTCIEPVHHGSCTSDDEVEYIEIELADGRRILFSSSGGWDDHYIEWSERSVS
jgi:hypothetical protein